VELRQIPRHHRLFLDILRAPQGVTRTLKRMNTYGVLGLYIPAFGRIVGRMQYDLFHAYTVDAHTLFVVENLRRFALPRFDSEFPSCSAVMQRLEKPEIAYLAGLFHDIAKGRGGDHSELGSVDAEAFCLEHGMSRYDARIVAWLVQSHLLLSLTAQKKDLNDPKVVVEFARKVGDQTHLDYLYVLTVADVRGTNPKIWNSWKDSLFGELYQSTRRALRRGVSNPIDKEEFIKGRQAEAEKLLSQAGLARPSYETIWTGFTEEYFLRHRPEEIAWHTRVLAESASPGTITVDVNDVVVPGLVSVAVASPEGTRSFMRATAVLDELGLTIVDARIVPLAKSSLDTYCVLESDGSTITERRRLDEIRHRLLKALTTGGDQGLKVTRRAPRQVRMFSTPVQITISPDGPNARTIVELVAGDRPGLLFQVAKIFDQEHVALQNAKIMTVGERAEDVFFVTNAARQPLDEAACERLGQSLREGLAEQPGT
jgi:[protein-PII] uridylyltransferase